MKIKVIVHQDGGEMWAEVPAIPGCGAEANSMEELVKGLKEAIEGSLNIGADELELPEGAKLVEIEV